MPQHKLTFNSDEIAQSLRTTAGLADDAVVTFEASWKGKQLQTLEAHVDGRLNDDSASENALDPEGSVTLVSPGNV